MFNKKRIMALAAVICVLSASTAYAEYDPNKVIDPDAMSTRSVTVEAPATINGATIPSVKVETAEGIKMIPLRSVAENLGYTVTWKAESRSIDLEKGAQFITMSLDQDAYAFSRRAPQSLGTTPTLIGDSTYVPLSFVDEILGGYFEENEDGTYKIATPSIVTATEITEDGALIVEDNYLGTVIVRMDDKTIITAGDKAATLADIKADMVLGIEYGPAMTASLPPQTTAVRINIENAEIAEEETVATLDGVISEITEDGLVIVKANDKDEYGTALVVTEDTKISKGNDKRIYKIDDLEVGMKISVKHSEAVTMSLPPQTVAFEIAILN